MTFELWHLIFFGLCCMCGGIVVGWRMRYWLADRRVEVYTGEDLDKLAEAYRISRVGGETDRQLRRRIREALSTRFGATSRASPQDVLCSAVDAVRECIPAWCEVGDAEILEDDEGAHISIDIRTRQS